MGIAPYFILMRMLQMAYSVRILGVFMIDAFSHFNINNAIMETLAKAGHDVTIISSLKPKNPIANITYIQARRKMEGHTSSWSKSDLKSMSWWQNYYFHQVTLTGDCELFMALQETKDILASKEKKYDLMFTELLPMSECYFPIAYRQNIPIIVTSTMELRYVGQSKLGTPYYTSVVPHSFSTYESEMTFIQRLGNTIETLYLKFIVATLVKSRVETFYQKYYPSNDPGDEKYSLIFLNSHSSISAYPYAPGIIEIGGVHLKAPNPLPADMEEFIRGAKHGVILFSLGSVLMARDLSDENRQIYRKVFAKIPQRVMWKFQEHVDGISDNVMVSEWMPQEDILAHKNVVLFITHAGRSSMMEAIHRGVPILALPFFGDQNNNAAIVKELGVGITLDRFALTEVLLLSCVQELLQNSSYKDKMKKLSRAFNDRPITQKETVLYWTEYVLKQNGTDHFRTAAVNMPFYQNHLIDVIFIFVFILILILLFVWFVVKKICSSFLQQ